MCRRASVPISHTPSMRSKSQVLSETSCNRSREQCLDNFWWDGDWSCTLTLPRRDYAPVGHLPRSVHQRSDSSAAGLTL